MIARFLVVKIYKVGNICGKRIERHHIVAITIELVRRFIIKWYIRIIHQGNLNVIENQIRIINDHTNPEFGVCFCIE
jgi:hypothetical protein